MGEKDQLVWKLPQSKIRPHDVMSNSKKYKKKIKKLDDCRQGKGLAYLTSGKGSLGKKNRCPNKRSAA